MSTPLAAPDAVTPQRDDDGALAERIAAAALAVPGVVRLHSGAYGEAGTYLPGRRIDGVRLRDNDIEVHIVTAWEANVLETADAVRAAVSQLSGVEHAGGLRVDVVVEDVAAPDTTVRRASGARVDAAATPQQEEST